MTAGNSCPLNDGAAAVLVMSDTRAKELGLEPKARIVSAATWGNEPEYMGVAPIGAIKKVLERTGMSISDIDVVELNEAFAAQVIPIMDQCDIPLEKLNTHGGAIALGYTYSSPRALRAAAWDCRAGSRPFAGGRAPDEKLSERRGSRRWRQEFDSYPTAAFSASFGARSVLSSTGTLAASSAGAMWAKGGSGSTWVPWWVTARLVAALGDTIAGIARSGLVPARLSTSSAMSASTAASTRGRAPRSAARASGAKAGDTRVVIIKAAASRLPSPRTAGWSEVPGADRGSPRFERCACAWDRSIVVSFSGVSPVKWSMRTESPAGVSRSCRAT